MGKKVGIMGGTFNPIHNAHLLLAERAYEQFGLDEIWFMPSRKPVHKSTKGIASEEERKDMIQIAIKEYPYFVLSTIEMERQGNTYTIDTMEYLHTMYADTQYYFIIGADSLLQLEQWHRAPDLLRCTNFLVANRDNQPILKLEQVADQITRTYGTYIAFVQMPQLEISSSDIRSKVHQGKSISFLLPEGVKEYIYEHNIYSK